MHFSKSIFPKLSFGIVCAFGLLIFFFVTMNLYRNLYLPIERPYPIHRYQPSRDSLKRIDIRSMSSAHAYQPFCEQPTTSTDSNTCAQWSSVQAVEETNRLTKIALRIALVGFFIATIGGIFGAIATFFLVKAFQTQRESNRIAREAIVSEKRAWLKVLAKPVSMQMADGVPTITIEFIAKNIGGTPVPRAAFFMEMATHFGAASPLSLQAKFAENCRTKELDEWFPAFSLFPEDEGGVNSTFGLTKEQFESLPNHVEGRRWFFPVGVIGCVQYVLVEGDRPHQTGFAFQVLKIPLNGGSPVAIAMDDLPLGADRLVLRNAFDGSGQID